MEAKDEYDDKLEATLFALSALSLNSNWKITPSQQKEVAVILKQIINNKVLSETCEVSLYANITKIELTLNFNSILIFRFRR